MRLYERARNLVANDDWPSAVELTGFRSRDLCRIRCSPAFVSRHHEYVEQYSAFWLANRMDQAAKCLESAGPVAVTRTDCSHAQAC